MTRRKFLRRALIGAPLLAGGSAAYGKLVERHQIEVVPVDLALGLGEPLTAVFVSDLHFDPLFEFDYLESVVAAVNGTALDVILFGGDFVTDSTDRLPELLAVLGRVKAKHGAFAVLGNHEHWVAADRIEAALDTAGITVLRNRSIPLFGRADWFLTGIESFWAGYPTTRSIESTPAHARHLLLVHEPDPFDRLTDPRIALQVSGHTHGGQVRVPFGGAIQLPTWGKKYSAGLYEANGRRLYVNRGIGTVNKHYRFNCRPEVTFFRLT